MIKWRISNSIDTETTNGNVILYIVQPSVPVYTHLEKHARDTMTNTARNEMAFVFDNIMLAVGHLQIAETL